MMRELCRPALTGWVLLALALTFARAQTRPVLRAEKLLRQGRLVQPPTGAANLAEYLKALADSAGAKAEGSYVITFDKRDPVMVPGKKGLPPIVAPDLTSGHRRNDPAPTPGRDSRSAFELLVEAINRTDIRLGLWKADTWSFVYSGDPARRISYAASGGLITRIRCFSRRKGKARIWTLAHTYYDKDLTRDVVAKRMLLEVLEAVNSKGVKYPDEKLAGTARTKSSWVRWQQTILLDKADFPGDRIARLRVRGQVALRTGAALFELKTLNHKKPVRLVKSGLTVTVSPLTAVKRLGRDVWQLPVDIRVSYDAPRGLVGFGKRITFFATDGKELRRFGHSAIHGKNVYKMRIDITPHSIDPSSTRMVIEYPTGLRIVPYELTFTNVRIKDVPPRGG